MSAGISGLKAHMDALNVVGNNVANVNTQGYKPGRVTFMESIYSTQSMLLRRNSYGGRHQPRQTGYGVGIGTIDLDMSSQSLDSTGRGWTAPFRATAFSWWEIRPTISTAWTPSRD
ncbi:MAG: flagellar basal body protein [Flavonifractor plautii]